MCWRCVTCIAMVIVKRFTVDATAPLFLVADIVALVAGEVVGLGPDGGAT